MTSLKFSYKKDFMRGLKTEKSLINKLNTYNCKKERREKGHTLIYKTTARKTKD